MTHPPIATQESFAIGFALAVVLSMITGVGMLGSAAPAPGDDTVLNDSTSDVNDTIEKTPSLSSTPEPTPTPTDDTIDATTAGPALRNFATTPTASSPVPHSGMTDHRRPTATLNCSNVGVQDRSVSLSQSHKLPPSAIASPTPAGSPPTLINTNRAALPTDHRGLCKLAELFSTPDWIPEGPTAGLASNADPATVDAAVTNTTVPPEVRHALKRDSQAQRTLRDDLLTRTNESHSEREWIFAAAEQALDSRRQSIPGLQPQLAAAQTNLRYARAMVSVSSTASREKRTNAVELTRLGVTQQVARINQTTPSGSRDGSLPNIQSPTHASPSAAALAILDVQNVTPTATQKAELRRLDNRRPRVQRELTDVLDAYLAYYRTAQAPDRNETRVRAAQVQLVEAARDLRAALEMSPQESPARAEQPTQAGVATAIHLPPALRVPTGASFALTDPPADRRLPKNRWPMYSGNPARTGHVDTAGPISNVTERWNVTASQSFYGRQSSPTVVDGTVYVGSDDHNVYALNATTGTERWNFTTDGGVASSPAVVNGTVFVGSSFPDSSVYALDAETGAERWNVTTGRGVQSSPAVVNGTVYVGSNGDKVYALDAQTGAERWNYTTGSDVTSSPAVADGTVYVGSRDQNVYALDAGSGQLEWVFPTSDDITATPAVANGTVYVGSWDDNVYALDASTGAPNWVFHADDDVRSSPAVVNGTVYVGTKGSNVKNTNRVYALDAATGLERWNVTTGGATSPAVANDTVYVASHRNTVPKDGTDYGRVYALDTEGGMERWNVSLDEPVKSSVAVLNGSVYLTNSERVYALSGDTPGPPPTPTPTPSPTPTPTPTPSPTPAPTPTPSPTPTPTPTPSPTLNESVQVGPLSIDLSASDTTYERDYGLLIDAGGDDTYNNNAGGADGSSAPEAAALIDMDGEDSYRGRNGGGYWNGVGFLVDAGDGADTYNASATPEKRPYSHPCVYDVPATPDAWGTNGGAALGGIGFLLDTGPGDTVYETGQGGTNGGALGAPCQRTDLALGFLLDAGAGDDTYDPGDAPQGDTATNGAGIYGLGFLVDEAGNETYDAGGPLTNGAGYGFGHIRGGGFLLDGSGNDTYEAGDRYANGGGASEGVGFLVDAGRGSDTYEAGDIATNGGGWERGVGLLLDNGGTDSYDGGNTGSNGGGSSGGAGFLLDGGAGNDHYAVTNTSGLTTETDLRLPPGSQGTNGGGWTDGSGFLLDGGGNDSYDAGSRGTNGGAYGELETRGPERRVSTAKGLLLDAGGNDTYTVTARGVNGGAHLGTGLLYDDAGTDYYTNRNRRCRDCSEYPKGRIGVQYDRNIGNGKPPDLPPGNESDGPPRLLVVDDAVRDGGDAACAPETANATYGAIQPAVDNTSAGDTVLVCAGTYPGTVTVTSPNVTLRAATPGEVVLDGDNIRRFGILLQRENTTVTGFTAKNFAAPIDTSTFEASGGSPDPKRVADYAALISIAPGTTIANTTVRDSDYGIIATGLFEDSPTSEVTKTLGQGGDTAETTLYNNTVTDAEFGILVTETGNVNVTSNTVTATQYGIPVKEAIEVTIHNNSVTGHRVSRATNQRGISSLTSQEVTISSNTVSGFTAPLNRTFTHDFAPFGHGYGIEVLEPLGLFEDTTHTLTNNTMANNTYNLQVYTTNRRAYKFFNIDTSNTVNGKPVLYLKGATNVTIGPTGIQTSESQSQASVPTVTPASRSTTPGYVACIRCANVTVQDLVLGQNGQGVLLAKSRNMAVRNVTVHDTVQGISLQGSPNSVTVTNNTVRESHTAIHIRQNCGKLSEAVSGGPNIEACDSTGVHVTDNTIQQTGFLFKRAGRFEYTGWGFQHGGAITVSGTGVRVQQNSITDAYGAGISVKISEPYRRGETRPGPVVPVQADRFVDVSVANNSVSGAYIGIRSTGNDGTTFTANRISDSRIGFYNIYNRNLLYRDNTVTNATVGMFVHFADRNITARNNTFRETRWGLDVLFGWYSNDRAPQASHTFGTSNTVNGERILWFESATNRVIDAADANMVVCVQCVNVTVRDMTLTDNAHGVVFWDAVNSQVVNTSITDTLHDGVTIKGGQNNAVTDSSVEDSPYGIAVQPINSDTGDITETAGQVYLADNHLTVENATYPDAPYAMPGILSGWTTPSIWQHWGLYLTNPTNATVVDNRMTNMNVGIYSLVTVVTEQVGEKQEYSPTTANTIRMVNNTVRHPAQPTGFNAQKDGTVLLQYQADTIGISVNTEDVRLPNATIAIRNNTLSDPGSGSYADERRGVRINTDELPSITVEANHVEGYERSVQIDATGDNTSNISLLANRLSEATQASVVLSAATTASGVEIHRNLLDPAGLYGYGVAYGTVPVAGGGHMGGGSGSTATTTGTVDATCNRWGAMSGPSSPHLMLNGSMHNMTTGEPLVDPKTGTQANGTGSAVSERNDSGVANVHFDPWVPPASNCEAGDVPEDDDPHEGMNHTETPTPRPTASPTATPTASPTPTATPTSSSPDGSGGGGGTGPGGGGTGGTGGDDGGGGSTTGGGSTNPSQKETPDDAQSTAEATSTSTSTATPKSTVTPKPQTQTPTPTPTPTDTPTSIPTPTPEVVPGFDVGSWLLAVLLLLSVLAIRRRD